MTINITTDMRPLRLGEQQWLFDSADLAKTPSSQDGIATDQELAGRKLTIQFMRSLWLRVGAILQETDSEATPGKAVMTIGAVLVHRFYMRRSLNDFSPKTLAPTILFLASKIEEAPLRLRHIVNATLAKFEPGAQAWEPKENEDVPQPLEYKRWEREILATEEVALEALCFDMAVDQPWPVLRRGVRGIDELWDDQASGSDHENGEVMEHRLTEDVAVDLGWAMLNEGYLAPLGILFRPEIMAFAVFVLQLAMLEHIPLSEALAAGAELAERFGLDLTWNEDVNVFAKSLEEGHGRQARVALHAYMEYCKSGLIDGELISLIITTPSAASKYTRRFKVAARANGHHGVRK